MTPCVLCQGRGTSQPNGCPSCGRELSPNPVGLAGQKAQERLGRHLSLSWRTEDNGTTHAKVMFAGEVIAVATDTDPETAIRVATDMALRVAA